MEKKYVLSLDQGAKYEGESQCGSLFSRLLSGWERTGESLLKLPIA
ncbi:MAG: hypothetical protein K0Q73_895 [Paenibacillus sp.]|nr:hypothetical protein [Paenibacillus sp.]